MATINAIEAVGEGLARHLRRAFELSGINAFSCDFKVLGATEFKALKDNSATCAIYLYRVTQNEYTRNQPPVTPAKPVAIDLHYLFSLWLDTANHEHTVLGWLVRELSRYPVLDPGLLTSSGGFAPTERLQFVPQELSLDDTAKLWQLLSVPYRLSLTYVVRNVQIGPEVVPELAPVAATRYEYRDDPRSVALEDV